MEVKPETSSDVLLQEISQKKAEYLQKFVNLFKDAPRQTGRFSNINVHKAK